MKTTIDIPDDLLLAAVETGATRLWTHNRGFVACPGLEVFHPL